MAVYSEPGTVQAWQLRSRPDITPELRTEHVIRLRRLTPVSAFQAAYYVKPIGWYHGNKNSRPFTG